MLYPSPIKVLVSWNLWVWLLWQFFLPFSFTWDFCRATTSFAGMAKYTCQIILFIFIIFNDFILWDTQEWKDKICLSVICFSRTSLNWLCINQHNADISSPLPMICTRISWERTKKLAVATKTVYIFFDAMDDTACKVVLLHSYMFILVFHVFLLSYQQTRCSQGFSTNTFVIHSLIK